MYKISNIQNIFENKRILPVFERTKVTKFRKMWKTSGSETLFSKLEGSMKTEISRNCEVFQENGNLRNWETSLCNSLVRTKSVGK
jgi:hypothetical protein